MHPSVSAPPWASCCPACPSVPSFLQVAGPCCVVLILGLFCCFRWSPAFLVRALLSRSRWCSGTFRPRIRLAGHPHTGEKNSETCCRPPFLGACERQFDVSSARLYDGESAGREAPRGPPGAERGWAYTGAKVGTQRDLNQQFITRSQWSRNALHWTPSDEVGKTFQRKFVNGATFLFLYVYIQISPQGTTAVASCRQERKDRPGPGAGLCWEQAPPGVPSVRRPHGSHTETSGPGLLGHRGTPSGTQAAPCRHHPVAQGLVLSRRLSRPRVAPGSGIAGSTSSGPFLSPAVLWPDQLARPRAPSRKWYCSLSGNI
nr:uncharacterized protein LOC115866212 [Globicephala melas]